MLRDLPQLSPYIGHEETIFMNGAQVHNDGHDDGHDQPSVDPLHDVFGSAPSSPHPGPHEDDVLLNVADRAEHSDIPRLRSIHVTNGYREGIAVSKEQHIQAGFDEGYSLGGEIGKKAGWYLGVLDGILAAAKKSAKKVGIDEDLLEGIMTAHKDGQDDLKMESLLSPDYFGPDGIWLYDVPGQDAGEQELNVTFKDVAAKHPVLEKWDAKILSLAKEFGLHLPLQGSGDDAQHLPT